MALDILTQDLIIDESTGPTDNDVNPAIAPHAANTTLDYLLGLDAGGGLASPEVAFRGDFVQATASAGETISAVAFAQDVSGTPFSTTVGVNSGLRTIDGDYVWLFQAVGRPDVVIGVIGTANAATEPDENGPLAFSLALIGTTAAKADLYTVQYLPLLHPNASNADDRIDLAGKVFTSVSATTVVNFSQLGDAPPGHNNWYILDADVASTQKILVTAHDAGAQAEVNVSTQGLGVSSQDVRFGRELQIDLISGGTQSAGKTFTNSPVAPSYTAHIESISSAGFSISQSTPTNTKADLEIHAYNNDDNAKGAALPGDDNDAEINITGATFKLNGTPTTAAALGITVDLAGSSLVLRGVGEGVTVDFTTAGGAGGTFDRFTIKNIDGDKDYFDVKEVHFSSDVPNAYAEEVGSFISFDDDGPSIDPSLAAAPTLTVDETTLAGDASASFAGLFTAGDFGSDGFKDADDDDLEDADAIRYELGISAPNAVSGLIDTLTNEAVTLSVNGAGTVVTGASATGGTVFTITLNANTGLVTLDQVRAVVHGDPADPDENLSPAHLSAPELVTLTATITDGDGDTDTASRAIGDAFAFEDDGPSIDPSGAAVPALTVDETVFANNASASFADLFTAGAFGNDGFKDSDDNDVADVDAVSYKLGVSGPNVASGLIDTLTNEAVTLNVNGAQTVVTGVSATGGTVFTITVNAQTGAVSLDQIRAVRHDDPGDPDENTSPAQLSAASLVTLTATITDGDGDTDTASRDIGDAFKFEDDGPSVDPSAALVPTLMVDETDFANDASASFAGLFAAGAFGSDGFKDTDDDDIEDPDAISYKLDISVPNVASGLIDTLTNETVTLSVNAAQTVVTGASATGGTVFTITVDTDTGELTLAHIRAVMHDDPTDPDESSSPAQLSAPELVTLIATITDGDGDTDTATRSIGNAFTFRDDGPSITVPVDTDDAPGTQTVEHLGNDVNETASGAFGYDLGADGRTAEIYLAGGSDFVDAVPGGTVQITLTGTVENPQNPGITNAAAELTEETTTSATFNWSFHYDSDPLTKGVQDGTAAGTLTFDKVNDTYSMTLTDPIDGFSFTVLHTNELLRKVPTGNTGHPEIVVSELDLDSPGGNPDGFYVQFTANTVTNSIGFGFNETGDGSPAPGDTAFNDGQLVTNTHEDWVSATKATNGVAGDTIQKGELLTLRFFEENILGDAADNDPSLPGVQIIEKLVPTTVADGIAVKFDGIGNSEDLIVILSLIDSLGNTTTRAVNVQNSDLIRGTVPAPYGDEFSLDNNDALLIIEANDYNGAGETYQIQGMQIMQSANGLTGNAIDLNGAIGASGGSNATGNLTAWDATDNDVLKIVDIGFVQRSSGTIDANLDFAFQLQDGDFDPTVIQHLLVNISNDWIS